MINLQSGDVVVTAATNNSALVCSGPR